jgi:anti-sigma regulatory factor (Ser/Thr protein kinase)
MYLNKTMPDLRSLAMLIGKLLTDDSFSREQSISEEEQYAARRQLLQSLLPNIKISFEFSTDDLGTSFRVTPIMRRIAEILEPILPKQHFLNIRLALEEVVSNIIENSYSEQPKKIIFRFTLTSQDISIEVEDFGERGKDYTIEGVSEYGSLEELRSKNISRRGISVFMVRKIMDKVRYEVLPGEYNKITIRKQLV